MLRWRKPLTRIVIEPGLSALALRFMDVADIARTQILASGALVTVSIFAPKLVPDSAAIGSRCPASIGPCGEHAPRPAIYVAAA